MSLNYTRTTIGAAGSAGAGFALEFTGHCSDCLSHCFQPPPACLNCPQCCQICTFQSTYCNDIKCNQLDVSCTGEIYVSLPMRVTGRHQVAKISATGRVQWSSTVDTPTGCVPRAHQNGQGWNCCQTILYDNINNFVHLWYNSCNRLYHLSFDGTNGEFQPAAVCNISSYCFGGHLNSVRSSYTNTCFGIMTRPGCCASVTLVGVRGNMTCLGGVSYVIQENRSNVSQARHECGSVPSQDILPPTHSVRYTSQFSVGTCKCSGHQPVCFSPPAPFGNTCKSCACGTMTGLCFIVFIPADNSKQVIRPSVTFDGVVLANQRCAVCIACRCCRPYCRVSQMNGLPCYSDNSCNSIMRNGSTSEYILFQRGVANTCCALFLTSICWDNSTNPTVNWAKRIKHSFGCYGNFTGLLVECISNKIVLSGAVKCSDSACVRPYVMSFPLGVEPANGTYGCFTIEDNLVTESLISCCCFAYCSSTSITYYGCCSISTCAQQDETTNCYGDMNLCNTAAEFFSKTSYK